MSAIRSFTRRQKRGTMRYIPLKSFEADGQAVQYREILKAQIERASDPAVGMKVAEMRLALKLLDKLEAATDVFAVEDAEFEMVRARVESAGWGKASRGVIQFVDDVLGAPTSPPVAGE